MSMAEEPSTGAAESGGTAGRLGEDRIEREVRVAAEPARVWSAWTEPERIAGWFVDRAVNRAEAGARVTWAWERFGVEVEQEVLVAEEPDRLVLRSPRPDGGASVLEVTLRGERGDTVVRVVQSGFGEGPDADAAREGADTGWIMALAMLREYVEHRYGRPKTQAQAYRPAPAEAATVADHFRDPDRLAGWLVLEGRPITGPVLADAGAERLRSWREIDGTLELKTFPVLGGGRMVGLRAVSWALPQEEMDGLESELALAVERLVEDLGRGSRAAGGR